MDRDFIARNQIVERYFLDVCPSKAPPTSSASARKTPSCSTSWDCRSGSTPVCVCSKRAASPSPGRKRSQRFWTRPQFVLGLVAAVVVLGVGLAVTAGNMSSKEQKIAKLQKQASERPLEPATNTRVIRLVPSHEAASNTPAVMIGGGPTQLVDFKIDETRSAYKTFRITIDRIDQGRVAVLHNLVKDSNGHLRIALNSSALGPGNYQLTIEGLSWRGDPEPDSWVTIGIQR